MLIRDAYKNQTQEELDLIRLRKEEMSEGFQKLKGLYEQRKENTPEVEEQIKANRKKVRELGEEIERIIHKGIERYLSETPDSELIDHAYKAIESITFEDFVLYLARHYSAVYLQEIINPDFIRTEAIGLINLGTDFGAITDYFIISSPTPDSEPKIIDLINKQDSLAKEYQQKIYDNLANLSDLFENALKKERKKKKSKTKSTESDLDYIQEQRKYTHLPTSMYTQTAMSVLARSKLRPRENPNQQKYDFSDSGYTINTIKDERLGIKGLALGYQKQSKNKNTKHPIFVLQNSEAITSKHNYNARKILSFVLSKLFEKNYLRKNETMPEYIDITTKELLDNQVFKSRKEAIEGANEAIMPLSSLSLAVLDEERETILKVYTLFPAIEQLDKETKTSVTTYRIHFQSKTNIDYISLFSHFTPCPSYYYRLSNRSGTLLYLIFARANENKDKFKEGERGSINIKLTDIQKELDLPTLEDVRKSRKENERILEPIKKAIVEITKTDKENSPKEPMLKLRLSNSKGMSAREYIENGYLEVTIVSDYILKKYREIESDHEHKTEVTKKIIARNKRLKEENKKKK